MPKKLIHYSAEPLPLLSDFKDCSSQPFKEDAGGKPVGLWVSVGDDWKRYSEWRALAEPNGSWLTNLRYETEVILISEVVRCLQNTAEIDDFTSVYGENAGRAIRWVDFAQDWGGIVIAPHRPERSGHEGTVWYKGWDVASGCIWTPRAISELSPLNY
jgi:hypothetical protein